MLDNIGLYLTFLAAALALLVAATTLYLLITPVREVTLIRAGNKAASLSLGGAVIGIALTLFGVGSSTFDTLELLAWGGIGVVLQVLAYVAMSFLLPGFRRGIEDDTLSYGIAGAALSIAVGLVNAAAISG